MSRQVEALILQNQSAILSALALVLGPEHMDVGTKLLEMSRATSEALKILHDPKKTPPN